MGNNNELRYKELREEADLKQKEIAEILNVKRSTYSKWENLNNDMPIEICTNLYKVSNDYILGLTSKREKITTPLDIKINLLGKKLFELRNAKNLSQVYLSEKVGYPQTTYSQYERGVRIPTTIKLLNIAQYYNISFDYLVGRSDKREIK